MDGIRPMEADDVAPCEAVWHDAFPAMRAAYHLPARTADEGLRARHRRHMDLLRTTDPGGSWVAVAGDHVIGFAQAFTREGLWVLSLLGVSVTHQGRGVARSLLERALGHGERAGPGLILSSRDPRAMHRYVQAGFALLPSVTARGVLRRSRLPDTPGVRPGDRYDFALVAKTDRRVRGAARGPELDFSLDEQWRLLVLPDRGYALATDFGVEALAAADDEAARLLLAAALAATPEGATVEVGWLTGDQQWAIGMCSGLGLEFQPVGAVMVRGRPGPMVPYIPSGPYA
jgi:GNAT superfamily N-acetyltransferase